MWSNKTFIYIYIDIYIYIYGFILKNSEIRTQFCLLQERQVPGLQLLVDVRHLTALGVLF
jgi:hypothetical protein